MQIGGSPRIPVFSFADAAARAACTSMQNGDLGYQEDTKVLYTYDGAAWNNILASVTQDCILIGSTTTTGAADSISFTSIATGYKKFIVMIDGVLSGAGSVAVTLNNDTGNNYVQCLTENATARNNCLGTGIDAGNSINMGYSTSANWSQFIEIQNHTAAQAHVKEFTFKGYTSNGGNCCVQGTGYWNNTANEISRIDAIKTNNQFIAGSRMTIWGLK